MNTSRRTKIIAEGIALYAAVQDLPIPNNDIAPSSALVRWQEWVEHYPHWVPLVRREQMALFDRLNGM